MIDTSFLGKLDRFKLILDRKVNSNYQGERKSLETGSGLVIKDYVQYTLGDDFRRVDWKVFGRTDKIYIKRYEEERNLTVHIIVDFSASMGFGGKYKKSDYASMLGVGFAYMALGNNERFVMSTFADELDIFRPRRGRRQLAAMVEHLNERKPKGNSNFEKAVSQYYKRQIKTKSIVFMISDFLYDIEEVRRALARYRSHKVILIQVLDPIESELQLEGDYQLIDSETQDKLRTHISPMLRQEYKAALAEHAARLKEEAQTINAEFYQVNSGDDIFDSFFKILA